jgi:hypothetical protein
MDMAYVEDALDCYNSAARCASQVDVELEVECEAALGKIYYKVLKRLEKAKFHYSNCVRLANIIYRPDKPITEEAWYQRVIKCLGEVRAALLKKEAEEEEAANKKYMDEIKDEMDIIHNERKKSKKDLFLHLMEKHLPEGAEKVDLSEEHLTENKMKKTVLKMIRIFHPDK